MQPYVPVARMTAIVDEEIEAGEAESAVEAAFDSTPVDYRTMQDIVFTRLRDEILAGRLKPGEKLNTIRLADQLGVSRMPVREALTRLTSVGLVEYISHRGAFVKRLSVEEVIELYYIRAALEGMAARLAIRNLIALDIARLRQLCAQMARCSEIADDPVMLAANQEFHYLIYQAAHSPRLEELITQYYLQSTQYRALGLDLPGRHAEVLQEHLDLVAALADGDPDRADAAARVHHLNTARRIARSAGSGIEI